jgi:hypothetical protein
MILEAFVSFKACSWNLEQILQPPLREGYYVTGKQGQGLSNCGFTVGCIYNAAFDFITTLFCRQICLLIYMILKIKRD